MFLSRTTETAGPFDFAQGRLFDSLRSLRMTIFRCCCYCCTEIS